MIDAAAVDTTTNGKAVVVAIVVIVAANVALGLIPAFIARSKGRSFIGWWALGLFFFFPALVAALVIGPAAGADVGRVQCPRCAEWIVPGAQVCRFCGTEFGYQGYLTPPAVVTHRRAHPMATRNLLIAATAISLIALVTGYVTGGRLAIIAFLALPVLLIAAGIVSILGTRDRPTWLKGVCAGAFAEAVAIPGGVWVGFTEVIEIALWAGVWAMTVVAIVQCRSQGAGEIAYYPPPPPPTVPNHTAWQDAPAASQPFIPPAAVYAPPPVPQHAWGAAMPPQAPGAIRGCRNPACIEAGRPSTQMFCTMCGSTIA